MTQQPVAQPAESAVQPDNVDATIAATVTALIHGRKLRVADVAAQVGMSGTGLYNKLNVERPFKAAEVAALATVLGVTIMDLYTGLGGMFSPPNQDLRARGDSNPRLTAYKVVDLADHVARRSPSVTPVPSSPGLPVRHAA